MHTLVVDEVQGLQKYHPISSKYRTIDKANHLGIYNNYSNINRSIVNKPNLNIYYHQTRWAAILSIMTIISILMMGTVTYAYRPLAVIPSQEKQSPLTSLDPSTIQSTNSEESQHLQTLLTNFSKKQSVPFYIVVKDLRTGAIASINANTIIPSASLYKLYVANEIYRLIDSERLSPDQSSKLAGYSIDDCLEAMITVSDNACGATLGNLIGWQKANFYLKQQGYPSTNLATPQTTTASDVARLLENIYRHKNLSDNSNKQFIQLLLAQSINNRIPINLPKDIKIAHKTGDLNGYLHDVGIIFAPQTDYLLIIMSGPWQNSVNGISQIASLSTQLYSFFNQ